MNVGNPLGPGVLGNGNLGNVNVVAFYYPLMADWHLMDAD
jgi:hypothetical protein